MSKPTVRTHFLLISFLLASIMSASAAWASSAIDAFEQEDYPKAKKLFRSHSDKIEADYYLGRIALIEKELDTAEDYLEKAVEALPENPDYHFWYGLVNARQAANASIFTAPGYASDAKAHFKKALAINPSHVKAMKGLISFYSNAPAIAGGSDEKALAMADKLYAVDAKEGLISKIAIYREQQELDDELKIAQQLMNDFPDSPRALLKAGFAYQYAKQYERALEIFEKAVKKQNEDEANYLTGALYQIGRTAALSEKYTQRGIEALRRYLEKDISSDLPSIYWAKFRLASLYLRQGNKEDARQLALEVSKNKDDVTLAKRAKKLLKKI
ncbi:tetratricopeptide repeat protein [Aliikangiella coralliicola]|uniref:Tetratricopeptide repeat protein n=1 Tax=Aliikangiella coralliicola TaxID=2592383 RepID=A0A545UIG0_9GAMM|nr:tetratricopeptide repeat protein [Aliikangiella coralliicola]TQV89252.1 tetratricopeptide repeat protein [Aliikangiella coralliicola]